MVQLYGMDHCIEVLTLRQMMNHTHSSAVRESSMGPEVNSHVLTESKCPFQKILKVLSKVLTSMGHLLVKRKI